MQITDVRVRKVAKEGKLKAVVSITMDDEFVVHDIKVIEGEKGLFIAMPSRKVSEGVYDDIAHPVNQETRQMFEDAIFKFNCALRETPPAKHKFFDLYLLLSEKGVPIAQALVGECYFTGCGTERNMEQARKYYKLAAEKGIERLQRRIAAIDKELESLK